LPSRAWHGHEIGGFRSDDRRGRSPIAERALTLSVAPLLLAGAWHEEGGELWWGELGHLETGEVGAVPESTPRRIERHLRQRGLLRILS